MTFSRLIVLFLLLLASAWTALVNGQPFFMADSSAYVRGPDFAVVYFLGPKFATSWTQERTLQGAEHRARPATTESSVQDVRLNSPFDKAVLSGRSVFYGALLYVGYLTSYFWLAVFAQAAIFIYLSYTFVVTCARLSFPTFVGITSTILIITPASFFISFLMPDIFASFLILATAILVGFWERLKLRDQICSSGIAFYSVLAHMSHLLLLVCLTILFLIVCLVTDRKVTASSAVYKRAGVLFLAILVGALGEQVLPYGARYIVGVDPVRPPYLMARLIADGPGYRFLQKNCATKPYVVCSYIDRLSFDATKRSIGAKSDAFLWSMDARDGVFNAIDSATRRALSLEETSFVFDVFRSDPAGVMNSAINNSIRQLLTVELGTDEFFLDQQLQSFKGKLLSLNFNELLPPRIVVRDWILTHGNEWFFLIYSTSMISLVLTWACWPFFRFHKISNIFPQSQWFSVLTITVMAILFNAAICGALSGPHPRYQTRISWVPSFVLLVLIAKLWAVFWPSKNEIGLASRKAETATTATAHSQRIA